CSSRLHSNVFFSSRRRHTRSKRDWSSDVCSSDLTSVAVPASALPGDHIVTATGESSGLQAQAFFTVRTDWTKFHFDLANTGQNRSEERRVGKDVRSRRVKCCRIYCV